MNPTPTPTELVLIASALLKDGSQAGQVSHEEWKAKLKEAHFRWVQAADYLDDYLKDCEQQRAMASAQPAQPISFEQLLAKLMPELTEVWRKKTFHHYFVNHILGFKKGQNHSDVQIEEIARDEETRMKKEGVSPDWFADFPKWQEDSKCASRSEAGRKGGEAKQANRKAAKEEKKAAEESKKRKQTKPELTYLGDHAALDAIAHPVEKTATHRTDS